MAVITISRQYGSGGDEIADRVCEALGYACFDKRQIAQAAAEVGLSEQEIIDFSEESHTVRNFLDRLFNRTATGPAARSNPEVRLSDEALLTLVQRAVRSAHREGNMLIVGRGGQVILQDAPDVLHVRIEAPMEDRIQRVKGWLREKNHAYNADVDLRRAAQDRIIERDAASADYIKHFYHEDWADPLLYHLVINTGKMTSEQAADLIAHLVKEIGARALEAKEPA